MVSVRSATLVLAAVVGLGACAPKVPSAAEAVAAADALDARFLAAFNAGNIDSLLNDYWNSPELVTIGLDAMGAKGWDAAKAGYAATMQAMPGAKMEFPSRNNQAFGDFVIGHGTWKVTIPAEKGPPTVLEGRYSDVKAYRDGKWVYVHDHASVPLPPAPPAPAKK